MAMIEFLFLEHVPIGDQTQELTCLFTNQLSRSRYKMVDIFAEYKV